MRDDQLTPVAYVPGVDNHLIPIAYVPGILAAAFPTGKSLIEEERRWTNIILTALKMGSLQLINGAGQPIDYTDGFGFVQAEQLGQWLEKGHKGHSAIFFSTLDKHFAATAGLNPQPAERASERPLSRQRFQEQEILRVIRELGYDPKSLPARAAGKAGVKAEVREQLHGSMWQGTVFKHAWDRLRENGEAQGAS